MSEAETQTTEEPTDESTEPEPEAEAEEVETEAEAEQETEPEPEPENTAPDGALASFRCSTGKVRDIINETAMKEGQDPFHSDIYLKVHDNRLETIVAKGNNSVLTNNTYNEIYFDDLTLEADSPVGAILPVTRVLDYIELAEDEKTDGTIVISLLGNDAELAKSLQMSGALNAQFKLPEAQEILDRVPMDLPDRFDDNERFHSSTGKAHTTYISTTVEQLSKIQTAVNLDSEVDFYPISVENGEFSLELGRNEGGERDRTAVWGDLEAADVKSADGIDSIQNWYNKGFEPLINTISSEIEIQTSPGAPMAVVKKNHSDRTVRHVLAQVDSGQ